MAFFSKMCHHYLMYYTYISSPLGGLTLVSDGKALTALHIEGDRYFKEIPAEWQRNEGLGLFSQVDRELAEYWQGMRTFFTFPVELTGTDFQKKVWQVLREIPFGSTTTYASIARQLGKLGAVRAVGTAVGRNPICIIVPCHRVVGSNGSLAGFVAGVEKKERLLALENKKI